MCDKVGLSLHELYLPGWTKIYRVLPARGFPLRHFWLPL